MTPERIARVKSDIALINAMLAPMTEDEARAEYPEAVAHGRYNATFISASSGTSPKATDRLITMSLNRRAGANAAYFIGYRDIQSIPVH